MIDESTLRCLLPLSPQAEVEIKPGSPAVASPSWWGADSERFVADASDGGETTTYFVKTMDEHSRGYVDWREAFAWATMAGEAGIGPEVIASDVDRGVLAMEHLGPGSETACIDTFEGDGIDALVEARKAVWKLPAHGPVRVVFDEIARLRGLLSADNPSVPGDLEWMSRKLGNAARRISSTGYDPVPCHGDGNVSNVVVTRDGTLRLVDWDSAALMDALQDVGVLLQELRLDDRSARPVFEMYWGSYDEALFDRARVYGVADCVRWGLIGLYCDQESPGTQEYSKFADWQFFRARAALSDHAFTSRVLNL